MSAGYFPKREKLSLTDLWRGLITASHILHNNGILDAYGHISVRNPDDPSTFYLPRNVAPALISKQDDIVEYKVEDASPVEGDSAPKGYIERYIHSEIFKRYPSVNTVIHSHAPDVLPYCVTDVPLKATIHMAGFLGDHVPVWDIANATNSSEPHDLLVRSVQLGHSFSAEFKPSTSSSFIYNKMRSALPSQIAGRAPEPSTDPDHFVVLMRGHGFTTIASGIEEAVFQAIYTAQAAKVQSTALALRQAHFTANLEGKVDVQGSGKISGGKVQGDEEKNIKGLSEREAKDAWKSIGGTTDRPYELWVREVEVNPLYRNEIQSED